MTAAFLVTSVWMFGPLLFPAAWQDRRGYNQLGFLLIASGLHTLIGLVLFFVAWTPRSSMWLAFAVLFTPAVHLTGVSLDQPWCFIPFVGPSVVIGVMFAVEVVRYLHPPVPDEQR